MCELNLVKVQCVTVNLLTIFHNKNFIKMCQSHYFQNECCSITSRRAVMCGLNMVKVQCVIVKLLKIFHNKLIKNVPKPLLSK